MATGLAELVGAQDLTVRLPPSLRPAQEHEEGEGRGSGRCTAPGGMSERVDAHHVGPFGTENAHLGGMDAHRCAGVYAIIRAFVVPAQRAAQGAATRRSDSSSCSRWSGPRRDQTL